jgi:nitroimidazol reductase NimA-like FMN-containing flavoprotein (pyridoxamine 5'-phosphate oxidase superfamily)
MLKKNSRCCFEVDPCESLVHGERPCARGVRYHSIIGFGRACFIEDCEEKKKGLSCIMRHYSEETYQFSDDDVRNVCVIRINIDSMTGKKHD